MEKYLDINNDSGISAYEINDNFIHVKFRDGCIYEYTSSSVGRSNLDTMKRLAQSGDGLNSFIMKRVKKEYSRKWR